MYLRFDSECLYKLLLTIDLYHQIFDIESLISHLLRDQLVNARPQSIDFLIEIF